jgi:hypothetical protein
MQKARGFVPAQANAAAAQPAAFPVKQGNYRQELAELAAVTGINEAQLHKFISGAA